MADPVHSSDGTERWPLFDSDMGTINGWVSYLTDGPEYRLGRLVQGQRLYGFDPEKMSIEQARQQFTEHFEVKHG